MAVVLHQLYENITKVMVVETCGTFDSTSPLTLWPVGLTGLSQYQIVSMYARTTHTHTHTQSHSLKRMWWTYVLSPEMQSSDHHLFFMFSFKDDPYKKSVKSEIV